MGSLKDFSGSDLGAIGIVLDTANVAAASVHYVIMGQVLTAGAGQMLARQAAVAAGIGWDVPALTVNKMCLSGLDAIAPRSLAEKSFSEPINLPMGVRAPATITDVVMSTSWAGVEGRFDLTKKRILVRQVTVM